MADFDYISAMGGLPDPSGAIDRALMGNMALRQGQAQIDALRSEMQRADAQAFDDQLYQRSVEDLWRDPSPQRAAEVMSRFPQHAKSFQQAWEIRDEAQRRSDLTHLGEVEAAGRNGRWDLMAKKLRDRIDADKGAGQDTSEDEMILAEIESGDPVRQRAALGFTQMALAAITGPDKFSSTLEAVRGGTEDYSLGPGMKRFSGLTNELVAEAPFAPDRFTLSQGQTRYESGATVAASGKFDDYYDGFLKDIEGGYAARDGRSGAPVNFGVNQAANPDVDVKNLTQDQAKNILRNRYWVASGADNLPPGLAEVHADTAVNMGVGAAKKMLAESGGDVGRYLDVREARYRAIGGSDLPGWLNRMEKLRGFVGQGTRMTAAAAPKAEEAEKPSVTRVLRGKTYYKIGGRWFDNPEGR